MDRSLKNETDRTGKKKCRLRPSEELRQKAEKFASGGKTKTERNIRAGWYIGRYRKVAEDVE